jgi:hypothetical protein
VEDECLQFIRDDSSQHHCDIFDNNQEVVKIEEEEVEVEEEGNRNKLGREKKRREKIFSSSNKIISRKKIFYRDKMISLMN